MQPTQMWPGAPGLKSRRTKSAGADPAWPEPFQRGGADDGQRVFDLSANTVARRIDAAARAAGIDPTNITASSPALGMAQDLDAYRAQMLDLRKTDR